MSIWIEICKKFQKPFSITEHGRAFGIRDREAITCPHCDALWDYRKSSGAFATAVLTREQETLPVGEGAGLRAELDALRAQR
jgi:hypothetical protein